MDYIKTYKEVEEIINRDFVMIIAKSHTCTACKTVLLSLDKNIPNLKDIDIHNIYIDDIVEFRGKHLIFSVPTVLIFSNGKELLRESRYINYQKVTRLIDLYRTK